MFANNDLLKTFDIARFNSKIDSETIIAFARQITDLLAAEHRLERKRDELIDRMAASNRRKA